MTLTLLVAFLAFALGYLLAVLLATSRRAGEAEYLEPVEPVEPAEPAEASDVWWAADVIPHEHDPGRWVRFPRA